MDLLINYGTTASAGGQPVIAEIQIGDTTTNINIQITQFSRWATTDFQPADNNDLEIHRSQLIEINGIDLFTTNSLFTNVLFYDTNGLYISNILQTSSFSPPTNAIYMGFNADNRSGFSNRISLSQFQSLTLSYSAPGATTTFYDSYPGGNVIGTTNGTEVAEVTNDYTYIIYDNTWPNDNPPYLPLLSNQTYGMATSLIELQSPTIIFNNEYYSRVYFINTSTNQESQINNTSLSPKPLTITAPEWATHFFITAIKAGDYAITLAQFQTLTASSLDQESYLQIDPPTGKRIKQIALKGL